MKTLSNSGLLLLLSAGLLITSCGRPYATYQKTPPSMATASVAIPVPPVSDGMPVANEPVPVVDRAQQTIDKLNVLVRNDQALAGNKNVAKRLARVNALLAVASAKSAVSAPAAPRRMNVLERMAVKRINRQIQKRLAPEAPQAGGLNAAVVLGVLAAIAGVVILLAVSGGGTVGVILLLAGLLVALGGILAG